jgi:hypothetical protein
MLDRVRRKLSRGSKSETFTAALDPDHGQRLSRTTTPKAEQATRNVSRLSLTPSDKDLVTKLAFNPEQPTIERSSRYQTPSLTTKWSERTVCHCQQKSFFTYSTTCLCAAKSPCASLAPVSSTFIRRHHFTLQVTTGSISYV